MRRVALAATVLALLGAGLACGGGESGPGVVTVLVDRPGTVPERATGFVAEGRRIVTVAHVLDGGGAVAVQRPGGGTLPARVVRVDRAADLALLDAGVARASAPPGGSDVRVLRAREEGVRACPSRCGAGSSPGYDDSAGPQVYARPALELAGEISGGDSGAPVVDGGGRLLGVVFARSRRLPGTAYAVDAAAVDRLLGR